MLVKDMPNYVSTRGVKGNNFCILCIYCITKKKRVSSITTDLEQWKDRCHFDLELSQALVLNWQK